MNLTKSELIQTVIGEIMSEDYNIEIAQDLLNILVQYDGQQLADRINVMNVRFKIGGIQEITKVRIK